MNFYEFSMSFIITGSVFPRTDFLAARMWGTQAMALGIYFYVSGQLSSRTSSIQLWPISGKIHEQNSTLVRSGFHKQNSSHLWVYEYMLLISENLRQVSLTNIVSAFLVSCVWFLNLQCLTNSFVFEYTVFNPCWFHLLSPTVSECL